MKALMPQVHTQVVVTLLPFLLQPAFHDNPSGNASLNYLGPLIVVVDI